MYIDSIMGTGGGILLEDSMALTQKRYCPKDSYYYLSLSAVWNCGIPLIYKDMGVQKLSSN